MTRVLNSLVFYPHNSKSKTNCGWVALNAATLLFSEIDIFGAECIAGVGRWVAFNVNR